MANTQIEPTDSETISTQRSNGDPPTGMSVAEAGRRGGKATAKRYGREFYQEIGRKGGAVRATDEDVRNGDLGRLGAEARWRQDVDFGNAVAGNTGAQSLNTRDAMQRQLDVDLERTLNAGEER